MARNKPGGSRLISNEAVTKATGKDWPAWFALLDTLDVPESERKAIVQRLQNEHGLSEWWAYCVLVRFEHERGLR
ncbi:MAG: hypothetical protein HXY40_16990 [Chloroflexi bacterium]|nr:hypothetical protein [Chloroflexota bacterium]